MTHQTINQWRVSPKPTHSFNPPRLTSSPNCTAKFAQPINQFAPHTQLAPSRSSRRNLIARYSQLQQTENRRTGSLQVHVCVKLFSLPPREITNQHVSLFEVARPHENSIPRRTGPLCPVGVCCGTWRQKGRSGTEKGREGSGDVFYC